MELKILFLFCGILALIVTGVRAVGNGLHHRIKRAYYPPYNYYYGPTFYQQQTRRNNIYPSYAMEPTRAFYPGYMQQSFERSYQQPYYQQARYQAPTVSFGATPFSGTVTPSKRTLYNFNTNPNPIALLTSSVKKYETLNSKKPIKMINIPFKEKTHFFIHKQNKQKPSLVSSAQNSISSHKRKHNGTVKTFVDSDKYRDRGLISRFNKLVKSFHKVSGIDSKELKNSSSKTLEDGEMKNPMEFEETRANRQNGTEEDTFEIEDSSEKLPSKKSDGHLTKHKEDQSKKNLSRTVDTEYSKKNETKASGEMDVLEVVESDQSQSMKKINKTIRQFLPVSTKENVKKLQSKFLNTTEASAKSGTHPQSKKTANSKSSKSVTKSSGLEKIAKKVKDGWNEMADAAVKLIKGEPKNDDKAEGNKNDDKAEGSKKEDHKLKQLLTTNIKQQEARLAKDMTGEDLYDPTIKMVNPKIPHSLANDALHGDWFDTAREPNEKTKNDIKMSSDVLSEISNAKMKGKNLENIQVATKQESKKQYESRVKKITNLAESTENEIISGLIQGSLGDAMPDKKPLKLKNMEKLVSSPEKTDVGSIQKLLSKYNDDFDVFVDKTVDNHIAGEPGIGKVVKQVNTMMDILPENEQNNVAPPGDLSDVTGNKKNFNGHTSVKSHRKNITLIDSNDDDDDTLMKRLSEKWKMFKEANKDVLQDTKHQVKETGDNTSLKSKLAAKKNKEKDILSRYFDQVEEKQAVAQSKELEARQTKRKERLRSTLQMISNIEREIDSLVNKDTVSEDSPSVPKQTTVSDTEKKEHKQKKGKAEIFKELTGDKEEDIKQQQELSYLKETPESFTDGQQQSKTFMGEATPSYVEPDVEEESEQPQNFMAQPQYEGGVDAQSLAKPQIVQEQPHNVEPQLQQAAQFIARINPNNAATPQEDVEEKQLMQSVEENPGVPANGRTIESTIKTTDQNENLEQESDLKSFQQEELKGDMARVQETTQNGLRDMFNAAVEKQQNFINKVQGTPNAEETTNTPPNSLIAMSDPNEDGEQSEQPENAPAGPENMAGDPQSMFGAPDKWQDGNNEPFNVIKDDIPETDSAPAEKASRKSEIMEFVQPSSSDNAEDDNNEDDGADNDNVDDGDDEDDSPTNGTAMFMALPVSS